MSEELVIRCCAPTLASIKTGNMFTCRFDSRQAMLDAVRALNRRLGGKGLRVLPLRYQDNVGLIYVYRPSRLSRDLTDEKARQLLGERGYPCGSPGRCLACLHGRLAQGGDFPHEIGLFLGYPPEDVDGFIHRKADAKCTGCWKVYGNVETAKRVFALYKKCTAIYLKQYATGKNMERLTVAV